MELALIIRYIGTAFLFVATLAYMLFFVFVKKNITLEQYIKAYGEPDEEMRKYLESPTNLRMIEKQNRMRYTLTFGIAGFGALLAVISLFI